MNRALIAALVLATAAPVAAIPVPSEAQVLVGGGARRSPPRRPRPPSLSEAEKDRLAAAQDEIAQLDEWTATLEEQVEANGGATAEQQALLKTYAERKAAAQEIVEQLEAKLNR